MRIKLAIVIGIFLCTVCKSQELDRALSNLFFQLTVSASVKELSAEMEKNSYLSIMPTKENQVASYKVIKSGTFDKHPSITTLGFRNEILLAEAEINSKKIKELSFVLNYRAEDKAVYEKQCKELNKKFRSYFERSEKKKNTYSFANESVNALFKNKSDSLPILKIASKQTFIEINNPKQSVYSIILTYQQVIGYSK